MLLGHCLRFQSSLISCALPHPTQPPRVANGTCPINFGKLHLLRFSIPERTALCMLASSHHVDLPRLPCQITNYEFCFTTQCMVVAARDSRVVNFASKLHEVLGMRSPLAQVITVCKRPSTKDGRLWYQAPGLLLVKSGPCLTLNIASKELRCLIHDELILCTKVNQPDFNESKIYTNLDLDCNRRQKPIDLLQALNQLLSFRQDKLGGSPNLTDTVFEIANDFYKRLCNPLDVTERQFNCDFLDLNISHARLEFELQSCIIASSTGITSTDHAIICVPERIACVTYSFDQNDETLYLLSMSSLSCLVPTSSHVPHASTLKISPPLAAGHVGTSQRNFNNALYCVFYSNASKYDDLQHAIARVTSRNVSFWPAFLFEALEGIPSLCSFTRSDDNCKLSTVCSSVHIDSVQAQKLSQPENIIGFDEFGMSTAPSPQLVAFIHSGLGSSYILLPSRRHVLHLSGSTCNDGQQSKQLRRAEMEATELQWHVYHGKLFSKKPVPRVPGSIRAVPRDVPQKSRKSRNSSSPVTGRISVLDGCKSVEDKGSQLGIAGKFASTQLFFLAVASILLHRVCQPQINVVSNPLFSMEDVFESKLCCENDQMPTIENIATVSGIAFFSCSGPCCFFVFTSSGLFFLEKFFPTSFSPCQPTDPEFFGPSFARQAVHRHMPFVGSWRHSRLSSTSNFEIGTSFLPPVDEESCFQHGAVSQLLTKVVFFFFQMAISFNLRRASSDLRTISLFSVLHITRLKRKLQFMQTVVVLALCISTAPLCAKGQVCIQPSG